MSKCIGGIAHEAVGSLATHKPSKSFGDLFEEKKAQLESLQAGLARAVLPKTPPMPAVKYSDIGFGIDLHKGVMPAVPLVPVPNVSIVFDIIGAVFAGISSVLPEQPAPPLLWSLWQRERYLWAVARRLRTVLPSPTSTYLTPEPQTELTTWLFDERTFVPSVKIVGKRRYSIISDYLDTPVEAYDEVRKRVWKRKLDIYGRVRIEQGEVGMVPFLYQRQYLDGETGMAYNRFRYYSPETGAYISQDPIRLEAGLTNVIHGHPITEAEYKKLTKVH